MKSSDIISSASVCVNMNPSSIVVNLVQFGKPIITSNTKQDLTLDPGSFSMDSNTIVFNANVSNDNFRSLSLLAIVLFSRIGSTNTVVECTI
jgi:hypothetical protein